MTGTLNLGGAAYAAARIVGEITVAPGAIINANGATFNGPLNILAGGVVNLNSGFDGYGTTLGQTTNAGTINWIGGGITLTGGDVFYNLASGVFNITFLGVSSQGGSENFLSGYPIASVDNSGLIEQHSPTASADITALFTNEPTGRVQVDSGHMLLGLYNDTNEPSWGGAFLAEGGALLSFDGAGILNGTFNAAAGGTNSFESGAFNLGATVVFTGVGVNQIAGDSATLPTNVITGVTITNSSEITLGTNFQGVDDHQLDDGRRPSRGGNLYHQLRHQRRACHHQRHSSDDQHRFWRSQS